MRKVEILAPAGSFESMKAAVNASCDGVYIGGGRFGARAFADNPKEQEMLEAIDYVHLHGKKLYMTVNTLLKEKELEELYGYMKPYYEQGLDAAIVQDIGAAKILHDNFPKLPLHASTQMTLTTEYPASILKSLGITRVVPARELSIKEIAKMRENTDLEIECFVHGALCYCYSGQCLLSSIIGGRSGNRGRCAQPCRMEYTLEESGKKQYLLSPKDICTLDNIPELIDAGIHSFKIEGRMKRPEYSALCTYLYGKYTDAYLEKGREDYIKFLYDHNAEFEQDKRALADVYNRGGFSGGYYHQYHGKTMMSMKRPGHYGVLVGKVIECKDNKAKIKLSQEIHGQDVLEFRGKNQEANYDYTVGTMGKIGSEVWANYKKGSKIQQGDQVYRTKNQKLMEEIQEKFIKKDKKIEISGSFFCKTGEPFRLQLFCGKVQIQTEGAMVEKAKNRPLEKNKLIEAIGKVGETHFAFISLEGEVSEDAFLPMGEIKQIRRKALSILEGEMGKEYKRKTPEKIEIYQKENKNREDTPEDKIKNIKIQVLVQTREQFELAEKVPEVSRIYAPIHLLNEKRSDKEYYLVMPYIFREDTWNQYRKSPLGESGYLIRNFEEAAFLKNNFWNEKKILDTNMYTFNSMAKKFWLEKGMDEFTIPLELNQKEIEQRGTKKDVLLVYGHLPLMISTQCIVDNCDICKKRQKIQKISDRKGKEYVVLNDCKNCYNILYEGDRYSLYEEKERILELEIENIRLDFLWESEEEMQRILKTFIERFCYDKEISIKETGTKGHFRRGVE
ncbi:MAG: DUF3656 domain-containing protein [Acetivibrio sp.]